MSLSMDSKIRDIMANPKGKEILDKYLPGMTDDKNFKMAYPMVLKAIKPMSKGIVTDEILKKIDEELKQL
jgi:hypothetical protein